MNIGTPVESLAAALYTAIANPDVLADIEHNYGRAPYKGRPKTILMSGTFVPLLKKKQKQQARKLKFISVALLTLLKYTNSNTWEITKEEKYLRR